MPFPSIPPILTVQDNGSNIVVTDATVYSSPARNTIAVFVMLVNPTKAGDVEYLASAFDPELATVFTFLGISLDGDFVAYYWAVSYKTGAETPTLNDFVWDAPTNVLQRWNGTSWVSATISDLKLYAPNAFPKKHNAHNPSFTLAIQNLNRMYVNGDKRLSKSQIEILLPEATITLQGATQNFTDLAYSAYQSVIEGYAPTVKMINA